MSKLKVSGNASGTGVITLEAPNTNTDRAITLPDSAGELINIAPSTSGNVLTSDGTDWTSAAAGGGNTPYFSSYRNGEYTVATDATWNKVALNAEHTDSDGTFDSTTNYRFTVPSGKAGKYLVSAHVSVYGATTTSEFTSVQLNIRKNGSHTGSHNSIGNSSDSGAGDNRCTASIDIIIDLSVGDYLENYVYLDSTEATTPKVSSSTMSGIYLGA